MQHSENLPSENSNKPDQLENSNEPHQSKDNEQSLTQITNNLSSK